MDVIDFEDVPGNLPLKLPRIPTRCSICGAEQHQACKSRSGTEMKMKHDHTGHYLRSLGKYNDMQIANMLVLGAD